jgi:hypothetical protein
MISDAIVFKGIYYQFYLQPVEPSSYICVPCPLVKVKLSLSLIKHHDLKVWRNGGKLQAFLTLALDAGEWLASWTTASLETLAKK